MAGVVLIDGPVARGRNALARSLARHGAIAGGEHRLVLQVWPGPFRRPLGRGRASAAASRLSALTPRLSLV